VAWRTNPSAHELARRAVKRGRGSDLIDLASGFNTGTKLAMAMSPPLEKRHPVSGAVAFHDRPLQESSGLGSRGP
jgi:hypothetical protein